VTHGTTTGTRLRPEDEVSTDAQFAGQQALYERRKLIDELVSTGVPAAAVGRSQRSGGAALAMLYILIPLAVIFYLATHGTSTATQPAGATQQTNAGSTTSSGGGGLQLTAQGVTYSPTTLHASAGKVTVTIVNKDNVVHNFAVFKSSKVAAAGGKALFKSPDVGAGTTLKYTFGPIKKGSYYFECEFHPATMKGTLSVT
jgi:plastocyanin